MNPFQLCHRISHAIHGQELNDSFVDSFVDSFIGLVHWAHSFVDSFIR